MTPGDGLPTPLGPLDPACVVFDIVPKPDVTPLMAYAAKGGCRVGGGRLMIDGQADAVLDFFGFGADLSLTDPSSDARVAERTP